MSSKITITDIKQALAEEVFTLQYQPKISMVSGDVTGAEALIRWKTSEGLNIPPENFIPVAEDAGIITQITKYVFSRLIQELPLLLKAHPGLVISFNASGKDFHDSDFTEFMIQAINDKRYPVENVEIEVTESVLLDEDEAKLHLSELAELGVPISMDDFGTGHSGLGELSKWPFSTVKIDKSFVNGIYQSRKITEILQSSIRMAHQLNMGTVAEGIEDKETFTLLQKYGCKTGQGFWISLPLAVEDFVHYLNNFKIESPSPIGVIYMAQLDHLQWKKTLIDAALYICHAHQDNSAKMVQGGLPELEHTCCKLGKWYYSVEKSFGHLKEYQDLEKPHRELHDLGKTLISMAENKCDFESLQTYIKELTEKSVVIINLLQSLENFWVLQQYLNDD